MYVSPKERLGGIEMQEINARISTFVTSFPVYTQYQEKLIGCSSAYSTLQGFALSLGMPIGFPYAACQGDTSKIHNSFACCPLNGIKPIPAFELYAIWI